MNEDQIRQLIRDELASFMAVDRFTFQKGIQIFDARNIQVGQTTGTKIGTSITQKIGFFGKTPVVPPSVGAVGGGAAASDNTARAGVDAIRSALITLGLFQ